MKIGILSGSNRADSQSMRIAQWFAGELTSRENVEIELVDLHEQPMSYIPDEIWSGQDQNFNDIKTRLTGCDGFVLVSPEWGGMASPAIKGAMIFLGSAVFADKPAYLVGVSDGRGGLRPVLEMRSFGFKNNYVCYIPEWLIVSDCKNHLLGGGQDNDDYVAKRGKYGVTTLLAYAEALQSVRNKNIRDLGAFEYGM